MGRRALVVALLVAPALAHANDPAADARQILRSGDYDFCTDPKRFVRPAERPQCEWLEHSTVCPEFAQACRVPESNACASSPTIGAGAAQAARAVFLTVLGVIVAWLAYALVRAIVRARRDRVLVDVAQPVAAESEAAELTASSSAEWLARALEARARGDLTAALYAVHAALLRALDARGAIHIDPAFTHGDYVRALPPSDARELLRESVREVERVRFGGASTRDETVGALLRRIEPIVRSAFVLIVAIALGASSGACNRFTGTGSSQGGGRGALRALLVEQGIAARVRLGTPDANTDTGRLVLVTRPDLALDDEARASMLAWVGRGGTLVVTPSQIDDSLGVATAPHESGDGLVAFDGTGGTLHLPRTELRIDPKHTMDIVAHFVSDGAPYAVRIRRGKGALVVLATDRALLNAALAVDGNPTAIVSFVRQLAAGRRVEFVDEAASGTDNPLRSLFNAGLLPFVLQCFVVMLLWAVLRGRHFATARDATPRTSRAFAEHVRAVGLLLARARASRALLVGYAAFVFERLQRRPGRDDEITARIAAGTDVPVDAVATTLAQIDARVADPFPKRDEAGDLRLVKQLHDWYRVLVRSARRGT